MSTEQPPQSKDRESERQLQHQSRNCAALFAGLRLECKETEKRHSDIMSMLRRFDTDVATVQAEMYEQLNKSNTRRAVITSENPIAEILRLTDEAHRRK